MAAATRRVRLADLADVPKTSAPQSSSAAGSAVPRPMLHINDLTFRIEGRLLLEQASVGIPTGHKVGLVGRNGTGKTTLFA